MFILRLLGTPALDGPNGTVTGRVALRQRVALLALLALEHPRSASRDKLVACLWPESGSDEARHSLRETLYIIRSALGEEVVLSAGDDLRLNPERLGCDVWEFEAALGRDDPEQAVRIYAGSLLSGFHLSGAGAGEFERWVEGERSRLARRYERALEQVAERHMYGGDDVGAVEWWTRLAGEDPYSSRIALRLMQALEAAGERAAALRHASLHTELLRTDLDAAPAPEVIALAERMRQEPLSRPGPKLVGTELPGAVPPAEPGHSPPYSRERRISPRQKRWIAPAALLLAATGAAVLVGSRTGGPANLDPDLLAVAPFDAVAPGLHPWSEGLVDVLSRTLDGSGPLRTVAPTVALKQWTGRADLTSAEALARRTGAGLVVFGALDRSGTDSVRIRAALMDVGRGQKPVDVEVVGDTLSMDRLVDSLAVSLLRELGRTRPVRAVRHSPLGAKSLPALKAFLQGEQLYRRGLWDSALPQYDRAIALDSTFALAYRRMGLVLNWFSAAATSYRPFDEYVRRAAALNHGLAPRDSLLVLTDTLYLAAMYDIGWNPSPDPHELALPQRLLATLREAQSRYPGDPEVWYALGEALYHLDDPFEAAGKEILDAFDRAIALDSGFAPAYIHTPGLALAVDLGDPGRARRYLAAYLRLNPKDDDSAPLRLVARMLDPLQARLPETARLIDTVSAGVLVRAGEDLNQWPDSAETAVRLLRNLVGRHHEFTGIDPAARDVASMRLRLTWALLTRGHSREAYRSYRAIRPDQWEQPYDPFVRLAILGAVPPDSAAAVFRRPLQENLPDGPFGLVRVLAWWFAHGDTVALVRYASQAGPIVPAYSNAPMVIAFRGYPPAAAHAYLTLARGDSAEALRAFAALPDSFCVYAEASCRSQKLTEARLLAGVGEDRRALEVLKRWAGLDPLALLEAGRLAERLGDREHATQVYRFVADIWRNADPELQPAALEASSALRRLTRR